MKRTLLFLCCFSLGSARLKAEMLYTMTTDTPPLVQIIQSLSSVRDGGTVMQTDSSYALTKIPAANLADSIDNGLGQGVGFPALASTAFGPSFTSEDGLTRGPMAINRPFATDVKQYDNPALNIWDDIP